MMTQKSTSLSLFNGKQIRKVWEEKNQEWLFSVVDIVGVLINQFDYQKARKYWNKLAGRLRSEGSESVTKCHRLKLEATDGKKYLTDVSNVENIFRIIQSVPSPNAEPLKLWLARVGYERVEETEDPELGIQRALRTYLKKGYSPEWVNLRLKSIEIRKDLTDEWEERGVKTSNEFAILTDDISFAWAGLKTKDYKKYKDLKKENLRDNMTNLELVLNMLAETATTEISKSQRPVTFPENRKVAKKGGGIAGSARRQIEKQTGKKVISKYKFAQKSSKLLK